jgi:SAM-dependent methyltransferase
MLKVPKSDDYYDGLNEFLLRQVPLSAQRILEIGCARGRLGYELKRQQATRTVLGIERDPAAAQVARTRLDQVFVCDVELALPDIAPGSFDCVIFGDVIEHLYDPESILRSARDLLSPDGVILVCVPNICHFSVVKALLRADPMYQPSGLLDSTHIRFFSHATFIKMLLDVGLLPDIVDTINSGGTDFMIPAATPLLEFFGVPPSRALRSLDAYQYVFSATKIPTVETPTVPITFVACVNDEDQLNSNLLRSPCLWPGTPHQFLPYRGMRSAADGFNLGLANATNDLVVLVHQDVYLPLAWDRCFTAQVTQAEQKFGPLGVLGTFGLRYRSGEPEYLGCNVDRDRLLKFGNLPAAADGMDEILLGVRRCSGLRADPQLGFHLYGADLTLAAADAGLTNVVVDAPMYHNSLFADVTESFHTSREYLLRKWPQVRPLFTNLARMDNMFTPRPPLVSVEAPQNNSGEQIAYLRRRLEETEQALDAVLGSRTWRMGRTLARILGRN